MGKKTLSVLIVALGVLAASNAFASRAKEAVLGTGDAGMFLTNGSFFYDTEYNIFYNPSYVNDFKNWGIIEKSNFPGTTAQGGFVASMMNFNLGVYMNRGTAVEGTYNGRNNYRPIEFMLGSDMGFKWGVGLEYGGSNIPSGIGSDWTLRVGAQVMDFEPFIHFKLSGTDSTTGTDAKNKNFMIGARYKWGEWIPYAAYKKMQFGPSGSEVDTFNGYIFGLGRTTKATESVKMHYALSALRDSTSTRTILPIDFSAEADATSWLVGMAGISYRFIDRVGGTNVADNTTGRIGADIKIGKADIIWAIGKATITTQTLSVGEANIPAGGATGTYPLDAQAFDIGSNFFTAAAFEYHW